MTTQITLTELSQITGYSERTLRKRPINEFVENRKATNGRPLNYYKVDVLKLFPEIRAEDFDLYFNSNTKINKTNKSNNLAGAEIKKSRSDSQSPKKPARLSLEERIKLENQVTSLSLTKYLSQSNKFNIKGAVEDACKLIVQKEGLDKIGFENIEEMLDYYYAKRIMRKDKYYTGAAIKNNWKLLWESNFNIPKTNNYVPKNKWDYFSLFSSLNLIGQGFGAGQLWAMDATQLDIWVDVLGKKMLIDFFMIIDVVTGFPLIINPITSESAESVIQTIIKCVNKWGVPRNGFILDNSSAFKSHQVQGFINLLYTEDEIHLHNQINAFKHIFGLQGMIKYPLAKIPTYFGKAKLERAFKQINEIFTTKENRALARKSTTEKNAVKLELGTVPTKALKSAQSIDIILKDLYIFIDDEYCSKLDYGFKYLQTIGIRPTTNNAFIYLGGDELRRNPRLPININDPKYVYYSTHKKNRHNITVEKLGQFRITEKQQQIYYSTESLTFRDIGKKIIAIKHPIKSNIMLCYLVYNPKIYDERVKNEGDVLFIGEAVDSTIRTSEDLIKIKQRAKLQKKQISIINDAKIISDDVRELLEFERQLNAKNYDYQKEQKYLDLSRNMISSQYLLEANKQYKEINITETELDDYYDSLTENLIDLTENNNNLDNSNLDNSNLDNTNNNLNETNNENNSNQTKNIEINQDINQDINLDDISDLFDFNF